MKTYIYKGEDERCFPTLGKVLKPNDEVSTDKEINHPELVLKEDIKRIKK